MSELLASRLELAKRSNIVECSLSMKIKCWELLSQTAVDEDNIDVFEFAEKVLSLMKGVACGAY